MSVLQPTQPPLSPNDRRPSYATSISQRVDHLVHDQTVPFTVESAFAEACNLVAANGARYSLVSEAIGNGPLNVVVSRPQLLAVLKPGHEVVSDGYHLRLASLWRLDLTRPRCWDPIPNYAALGKRPQVVYENLQALRAYAAMAGTTDGSAMAGSALSDFFGTRASDTLFYRHANSAIASLQSAWRRSDMVRIRSAARRLAGLGPGLTPAGDDWLSGWLLGLRARAQLCAGTEHPNPNVDSVGRAVRMGAANQTTQLSLAFLAAAADGAASQPWHDLIAALTDADPTPIHHAVDKVCSYGATSGADMLAGFLSALSDVA